MEKGKTSGAGRAASYWLLAKRESGWTAVLTVGVCGEEALPIFSFEEEARLFSLFEDLEPGWQARETTAVELRHVLSGSRVRASTVVLDPLPTVLGEETNLLVSLERGEFVRGLAV